MEPRGEDQLDGMDTGESDPGDSDPGDSRGITGTEGEGSREPTVADLAGILRAHMGQQEARDAQLREESVRQEERFKSLYHQFQMLQLEVQARPLPVPEPTMAGLDILGVENRDSDEVNLPAQAAPLPEDPPAISSSGQLRFSREPRLEKLTEADDIEHFFTTFERIAAACKWPHCDWVFRLIPLLTSKARSAYVHMDMDDAHSYDDVKDAILKKYDINPETYRQRFRFPDVEYGETPKELYVRLKELYGKWIQPKGKTSGCR